MALLFIEGFDAYGTTNGIAPTIPLGRYSDMNNEGSMQVQDGRGGVGKSLFMNGVSRFLVTPTLGNIGTIVVGFAWKFTGTPGAIVICSLLENGTLNVNLQLTAGGEINLRRGGTTLATTSGLGLSTDVWYYIELKVTTSNTGSYELRVNGVNVLSDATADTQAGTTNAFSTHVKFEFSSGGAQTYSFDDVYILDSTGSVNNDFLGPRKVITIFPNAEGDTINFTPSTGTDNSALVDENPNNGNTDYVESGTTGHKDLYQYGDLSVVGSIAGIQIVTVCADDGTPATVKTLAKSGATESADAGQVVGSTEPDYKAVTRILETNPDTAAAWTPSEINSAQFGIEVG